MSRRKNRCQQRALLPFWDLKTPYLQVTGYTLVSQQEQLTSMGHFIPPPSTTATSHTNSRVEAPSPTSFVFLSSLHLFSPGASELRASHGALPVQSKAQRRPSPRRPRDLLIPAFQHRHLQIIAPNATEYGGSSIFFLLTSNRGHASGKPAWESRALFRYFILCRWVIKEAQLRTNVPN